MNPLVNAFKDSAFLNSVEIFKWHPYNIIITDEQLLLQIENFTEVNLYNKSGSIKFIFTRDIETINERLEQIANKIKLQDSRKIIEDEVFYTTKIEGAKTTRIRTTQIHDGKFLNINNYKSEKMVQNAFRATKMLNLSTRRLTKELLIKVWNILVDDVCDNESVRGDVYRSGDVYIGSYTPSSFKDIDVLMDKFINFFNSDELDNYPYIKSILLHFAFETIHPFCDGNGRLGRLLLNYYLITRGIESAKAVSFSMFIDKSRGKYEYTFVDSENDYNDCTPFIEYMLTVMLESYINALGEK